MNKYYLTPSEQYELDPTGQASQFIRSLINSSGRRANPSSDFEHSREALVDRYTNRILPTAPVLYRDYEEPYGKKLLPQGGTPAWSELFPLLQASYMNSHKPRLSGFKQARHYLLRRIDEEVSKHGLPTPVYPKVYRTNASLPTMGRKGSFIPETVGMSPWRHVVPLILGARCQFDKPRLIYQDSIVNVRYVEQMLASVRHWLRTYLPEFFGAWTNPHYTTNRWMTEALDYHQRSVEGDYEHMDQRFSRPVAQFLLPVYERLLPAPDYWRLAAYVGELFYQPVFMGDYMYTGEHNLFSGIGPTQDFETIWDVINYLQAAFDSGHKFIRFMAVGDDATALFESKVPIAALYEYYAALSHNSAKACMVLNDTKCRVGCDDIRFCRRTWYPGVKRDSDGVAPGAYSGYRTLWNCVWPEKRTSDHMSAIVACYQRCDNLYGSPVYVPLVQSIIRAAKWSPPEYDALTSYLMNHTLDDWWDKLYGQTWNPETSKTWQLTH